MVEESGRLAAAEKTAQPDLVGCRVEEVLAADDEVDPVAQVVYHHREAIRPVAVAITGRRIPGCCDRTRSCPEAHVVPGLVASTKDQTHDPPGPILELATATPAGAPGSRPRHAVSDAPIGERRPRAIARIHETAAT